MANYIIVEDIEDGMILAEPVLNKFGNVLLGVGAILSTSHITLFKTWNIQAVTIKSLEQEDNQEIGAEQRQKAALALTKRMKWYPRNDIEKDLYNLAILVTAQKFVN